MLNFDLEINLRIEESLIRTCKILDELLPLKKKEINFFLLEAHNGPYKDSETIYRSCSHIAIIYLMAYKFSSANDYLKRSQKFLDLIINDFCKMILGYLCS